MFQILLKRKQKQNSHTNTHTHTHTLVENVVVILEYFKKNFISLLQKRRKPTNTHTKRIKQKLYIKFMQRKRKTKELL